MQHVREGRQLLARFARVGNNYISLLNADRAVEQRAAHRRAANAGESAAVAALASAGQFITDR